MEFDQPEETTMAEPLQLMFARYIEFALADGDNRTVVLSFAEWLHQGKPMPSVRLPRRAIAA